MMNTNGNQCLTVLSHLKKHGSIEPLDSLKLYGIYRLSARILDLRNRGHRIDTIKETSANGKKYARYIYRGESLRTSEN